MLALTRFTPKLNLLELLLIAHRKFNRDILKTVDVRLWTNKRADRSDCMAPPFLWRKQPLGKSGLYSFQDSASTLITCPPDGDVSEVQRVHKVLIAHLKSESATKHRNDAFRPNAMERVCSAFTSWFWYEMLHRDLHASYNNQLKVHKVTRFTHRVKQTKCGDVIWNFNASYKINHLWRWQVWLFVFS